MTAWVQSIPSRWGKGFRVLCSDRRLTAQDIALGRARRVDGIQLLAGAARGPARDRLRVIEELAPIRYLELRSPGNASLPEGLSVTLETLVLTGKVDQRLAPEGLTALRSFTGPAQAISPGEFGSQLRRLHILGWQGFRVADLPLGPRVEELEVDGAHQRISLTGLDLPRLRKLVINDVEIDSLDGMQGAPNLIHLGLHPSMKNDVSVLRELDLRPLDGARQLRWLVVGRQGRLTHVDAIAGLPNLEQVLAYESFLPSEHHEAPWAAVIPDSKNIRRLLRSAGEAHHTARRTAR